MSEPISQMRREIAEIPAAAERLISEGSDEVRAIAAMVRQRHPTSAISVARGSSDHVCTYLKYVSELVLGWPMTSMGPSITSIYDTNLTALNALCLSVSQSGQSPDIVSMTKAIKQAGAISIAITNNITSRLSDAAEATLSIRTGPENSVAATKTFVSSLISGLWLLAEIKGDKDLIRAIHTLPQALDHALGGKWVEIFDQLPNRSLYTLGRGPSLAIANEAALKFKEVCLIHAESYSSAEVMHGPVSIVEPGFPVFVFTAADAAEAGLVETADRLAEKGAQVFITSSKARKATPLPHVRTDHWLTDPIAAIVSFYCLVERLAVSHGLDPDLPRHLKKVTETV